MTIEVIAIIISAISLMFSAVSLVNSIKSQAKAGILANENTRLSNGMIELEVRSAIREETARVNEIGMKLNPLIAKKKVQSLTEENKHELEALGKNWKTAIQGMLNVYEEACTKYLDEKIDKRRFKKTYQIEIRNLIESQNLKQYFDTHASRYKAIIRIYDEWENQEK